jgi:hypothetical protein
MFARHGLCSFASTIIEKKKQAPRTNPRGLIEGADVRLDQSKSNSISRSPSQKSITEGSDT